MLIPPHCFHGFWNVTFEFGTLAAFCGQYLCPIIPSCCRKRPCERRQTNDFVRKAFGKAASTHGAQNNWSPSVFQRPGWSRERKRSSGIKQPRGQVAAVIRPRRNLLKTYTYLKPAQNFLCPVNARNRQNILKGEKWGEKSFICLWWGSGRKREGSKHRCTFPFSASFSWEAPGLQLP